MMMELERVNSGRNSQRLGQGVVLHTDYETDSHYVLIPVREDVHVSVVAIDAELAVFGLERMPEEECESVVTDSGIKVWCAEIYGGSE